MTGKIFQNKFVAVIPAYNPGCIVTSVVAKVREQMDYVILIDDGSDAENKEYLKECAHLDNVCLIISSDNKGKGYALIAGMKEAMKHSPDYILTIDSDGQHDPKEISKFKHFLSGPGQKHDLVVGVRQAVEEMPLRSKIGNVFTAKLFTSLFNRPIVDTQSGFRALSRNFAEDVIANVLPGRYETEMRMLVRAVETNRKIETIKIETIYFENNRNSKFRPLQDSLRVLVPLSKYTGVAVA